MGRKKRLDAGGGSCSWWWKKRDENPEIELLCVVKKGTKTLRLVSSRKRHPGERESMVVPRCWKCKINMGLLFLQFFVVKNVGLVLVVSFLAPHKKKARNVGLGKNERESILQRQKDQPKKKADLKTNIKKDERTWKTQKNNNLKKMIKRKGTNPNNELRKTANFNGTPANRNYFLSSVVYCRKVFRFVR